MIIKEVTMNNLIKTKRNHSISSLWDFDTMIDSLFNETPFWNTNVPSVDVREEDDRYRIEAELPGLTNKDIDVKVEHNILSISSKKEDKKEEKKKGYILKERRSSSFCRSFVLPKDVDRDNIDASFTNGILTLDLFKSPDAKPKNIDVKVK